MNIFPTITKHIFRLLPMRIILDNNPKTASFKWLVVKVYICCLFFLSDLSCHSQNSRQIGDQCHQSSSWENCPSDKTTVLSHTHKGKMSSLVPCTTFRINSVYCPVRSQDEVGFWSRPMKNNSPFKSAGEARPALVEPQAGCRSKLWSTLDLEVKCYTSIRYIWAILGKYHGP